MNKHRHNLKKRLVFKISSLSTVAALIMILITGAILYRQLNTQMNTNLRYVQYHLLQDIENRLSYLSETIDHLSKNKLVINGIIDEANRDKYLPKLINDVHNTWGIKFLTIYNFQGKPIISSSDTDYSVFTPKDIRMPLVSGKKYWKLSGTDVLMLAPVEYYNTPQAVIAVCIDLKLIFSTMSNKISSAVISIYSKDAKILSYGDLEALVYTKSRILYFDDLDILNTLNIGIKYSPFFYVFFKPIFSVLSYLTLVGAIFIVISVITGYKLARDISQPILELCDRVQSIDSGETPNFSPLGTDDELEILDEYINAKANELISARKKVEAYSNELRVANLELEKRVADRTEELNIARKKAETANEMKSQFLANMSHEIRTPMNAIIGFNQLMQKTETTPKQTEYIAKTQKAALHLLGVINDILDITKIESGMISLESTSFHLFDLLNDVRQINKPKADEKGIEFETQLESDMHAYYMGDPLRIGQILINLTSNAIKFTNTGKVSLAISAEKIDPETTMLEFNVIDTGIGITEEVLGRLFKPFTQAEDSTARKYGGTGLGLSISLQLATLMSGNLYAKSKKGEGSCFTLRIPLRPLEDEGSQELIHFPRTSILGVWDNNIHNELSAYISSVVGKLDEADNNKDACAILDKAILDGVYYNLIIVQNSSDDVEELLSKAEQTNYRFGRIYIAFINKPENFDDIETEHPGLSFMILGENYSSSEVMNLIYNSSTEITQIAPDATLNFDNATFTISKKVLVVEDNEVNRQVIRELLGVSGIQTDTLNNGAEAVELLSDASTAAQYALVFMDIQMPVMDGYEATERLTQLPHMKNLPIVALSADAIDESQNKAISVGMQGFITKPFTLQKLLEALQKWGKVKIFKTGNGSKETSDEIYGIDRRKWFESYAEDEELFRESLALFIESSSHLPTEAVNSLKNNDVKAAALAIHSFKGASGTCCLTTGYHMACKLDNNLRDNELSKEELIDYGEKLEKETAKVASAIKKYLTTSNSTPAESVIDSEAVNTLSTYLEEGDTKARKYFLEIKDALTVYLSSSELKLLESHISTFSFDAALDILMKATDTHNGTTK